MRFFVESYGCTMNHGEGGELSEKMRSLGHSETVSADEADIVILNTCTVVDATEKKMISRMSDLKKKGKDVIVTGCMAKAQVPRITVRLPDSLIIPPERYDDFSSSVTERFGEQFPRIPSGVDATMVLPIAQGCVGNCSYCITKKARGDLRSYDPSALGRRFADMIRNGAKEVLVTAQDTACYGADIGTDLPELLRRFLRTDGDYKVRIGMMNPDSLSGVADGLMDAMDDDRMYRFIHVPVQSGSDRILKMMGRRYTAEGFLNMIKEIRCRHPDMSISTDIITGFPGETDDDHMRSIGLLKELGADTVNVTRFSARPGTPAFSMDGQVHGRISKERSRDATATKSDEAMGRNRMMIGGEYRVLVTEKGKEGTVIARTGNYRPVVIPEDLEVGGFVDVRITSAEPAYLFGTLC